MNPELAARLFELFAQREPVFETPVPPDEVDSVSIRFETNAKMFLHLTMPSGALRNVQSILTCMVEDPVPFDESPLSAVIARSWVLTDFYLQLMFGSDAPKHILTRCAPNGGVTPDLVMPASILGSATAEVDLAFLAGDAGSFRYLDPAIVIRLFALFSDDYQTLLFQAIQQDSPASFGLSRFLEYFDNVEPVFRRRLFQEALRMEYQGRIGKLIATPATTEALYTAWLPIPQGPTINRDDLVANYHIAVETDPDRFAYFHINELNLDFVVFGADQYEMNLIDIRSPDLTFSDLAAGNTQYKIIVNGPVFDMAFCGKQNKAVRLGTYLWGMQSPESMPGLTKGTLVFRGGNSETGQCPIPNDPSKWRFHFAQSLTPSLESTWALHPNPIPANHQYQNAVEPVIGVFREGQRIGIGHDIDTDREEPDSVYANANRAIKNGIPILGICRRSLIDYFFVLIRPDYYVDQPIMAGWEDMIELLTELGVVDAFVTDGDDSVGLIIDNTIEWQPGLKKDLPMPLAIGFRKL
jgi:hypothetical protein